MDNFRKQRKYNFDNSRFESMCIYTISDSQGERKYVGQSVGPVGRRWRQHVHRSSNPILKNLFKKYGSSGFTFSVIDRANTREDLDEKESYWINKLQTMYPKGFNFETGGSSNKTISNFSRQKMRNAKLGKKASLETRLKQSKHIKESITEEFRKSVSLRFKGIKRTEKEVFERAKKHKGFKFSEQQKIRLSRSHMQNRKILCSNGKTYLSSYEAHLDTKADQSHIGSICNGKRKSSKGFSFSYLGENSGSI